MTARCPHCNRPDCAHHQGQRSEADYAACLFATAARVARLAIDCRAAEEAVERQLAHVGVLEQRLSDGEVSVARERDRTERAHKDITEAHVVLDEQGAPPREAIDPGAPTWTRTLAERIALLMKAWREATMLDNQDTATPAHLRQWISDLADERDRARKRLLNEMGDRIQRIYQQRVELDIFKDKLQRLVASAHRYLVQAGQGSGFLTDEHEEAEVWLAGVDMAQKMRCDRWTGPGGLCTTCGVPAVDHPGAPTPKERGCDQFEQTVDPKGAVHVICSFCALHLRMHDPRPRARRRGAAEAAQ